MNLKTFLNYLDKKVSLKQLDEPSGLVLNEDNNIIDDFDGFCSWPEIIFDYSNNNFINNQKNKKLILKNFSDNFQDKILNTAFIDDERIIIVFKQYLKVYNYKKKNEIATIENIYCPDSKFKLNQIFKDLFVILYNSDYGSILKIFSINSNNKILFEKSFIYEIKDIKIINNNSFGLLLSGGIEIYKSSENFQEFADSLSLKENYKLNLEIITKIIIEGIKDFVYRSSIFLI